MGVVISLLAVAESAQRFNDGVLRFGLPGIDHVVNLRHIAKMRMIGLAIRRRDPAVMPVGIAGEPAISEIAPQQPKLPQVVGDVFADIAHGSVRSYNDFLVFLSNLSV